MNNILFCTSLVTEGTLMDDYSAGALGLYDMKTLEFVDNTNGKPFGLIGSGLLVNGVQSVVNIPDIHVLNINSATIPLNLSYSISIEAATLEEESTDTSDVEIIILHKNVVPNGNWRQFITIPYSDFEGDTDTLLDIIEAKLKDLSSKGKLENVLVQDINEGVIQLYISNTDQYEIITKSELLDISTPSGYLPVVAPAKIVELIDKNTASWGIWHREEDDNWYKDICQIVSDTTELNTIISIRYYSPRIAGVTHDETLYKTLHIITTEELVETIVDIIATSESEAFDDHWSKRENVTITISYGRHGTYDYLPINNIMVVNGAPYYGWYNDIDGPDPNIFTEYDIPEVGGSVYIMNGNTPITIEDVEVTAVNENNE